MMIEETEDRVYIAKSPIPRAGKGLFAKVPLAKGDEIEVVGVLARARSVQDEATRYADPYKFRVGDHLLIPTGYGAMANHSSTPNMEKVVVERRVYLRALRPIEKDEELSFVYGERAQKLFEAR